MSYDSTEYRKKVHAVRTKQLNKSREEASERLMRKSVAKKMKQRGIKNLYKMGVANKGEKETSKVLHKTFDKPWKMKGMSPYSSSHNSGYDDNYLVMKGKGTADDPFRA